MEACLARARARAAAEAVGGGRRTGMAGRVYCLSSH